jgi:hypothetical protein
MIGVDAGPNIAGVKHEFPVDRPAMKLPRNYMSTLRNSVDAGHPVTRVVSPALPDPAAGRLAENSAQELVTVVGGVVHGRSTPLSEYYTKILSNVNYSLADWTVNGLDRPWEEARGQSNS